MSLDEIVNECAGMAARRIAVARFRAQGLSWSQARKASLTVEASEEIKALTKIALERGIEPKQAVHRVVEWKLKD